MEKEKLIIRNFGPIKEVDLDLGRVTVLIGEQATGKSTVAKVLAVCRYFSYIVGGNVTGNGSSSFFDGLISWGLREYIKFNTYISYKCQHYNLVVEHSPRKIGEIDFNHNQPIEIEVPVLIPVVTDLSERFENLLFELKKIQPVDSEELDGFELDEVELGSWTIPTSFYLNDVKNTMDNPFYFPTQRGLQSIFDIGQHSIKNLSSALFNQLSKMDGIARLFKQETYIEPLDIYYVNRDGHGFIRKANEASWYSLYNAASGYQSMIPIVLTVKYYEQRKRKKTFLIEEAEQNLFPSAQNKLMQYLVEHVSKFGGGMLITTQSPYILASLNNCIYAHTVGLKNKIAVSEIIDEKYWLDPDDVSSYRMLKDGTARNIIDAELKEIRIEEIDEVSKDVINKDYDRILDVKFGVNDAA